MTETMETIDGVRHCSCGCGGVISPHNKSGYLRGHKSKHRFAQLHQELNETLEGSDTSNNDRTLLDSVPDFPTGPGDKLSKEVRADIQDKLDFILSLIGVAWETKDPYCGGEFSQRATRIAEKLVPLIARNETLLKFFSSGTRYSDTFELAIVLWPVAKMTVRHHVTHTVGEIQLEEVDPLVQYPVFNNDAS